MWWSKITEPELLNQMHHLISLSSEDGLDIAVLRHSGLAWKDKYKSPSCHLACYPVQMVLKPLKTATIRLVKEKGDKFPTG